MENERCAILDIGSNSVRIAMFACGKIFYKGCQTTQLAKDRQNNLLDENSIQRTLQGADRLIALAKNANCDKIFAFATAAVRNSDNGNDFCHRFFEKFGIKIDILSGEEEGKIGINGAMGDSDGTVIDVGGGSSEIITQSGGKITFLASCNIGAVSLTDSCGKNSDCAKLKIAEELRRLDGIIPEKRVIGIGGTANTLAFILSGLKKYSDELIDGIFISKETLSDFVCEFYEGKAEKIAAEYNIDRLRANVIHSGAIILLEIMRKLKVDKTELKSNDNLEGYYNTKLRNKHYE